jgi:uncharacterized protein (TIGR03000 family)
MLADNSSAFFGLFRGGSHGSGGGWGSRGGWGSCGSHGGYYGGSHGGWGSHGGSWGGGGSHGGSHGSHGGYYSAGYGGYDDGYYARRGVVRRYVSRTPVRETIVAASAAPATKTRLTIRVPAEASVTLAGVSTKQTGEVRQFTTTRLTNGQVWDDYKVVVAVERNGQTLREERTISLTGGQAQELSINFDSQQLAQK